MTQEFDSSEEMYMDWWLQELKDLGFIKEIIHQPEPYKLSDQLSVDYYEPYKKRDGGKLVSEEMLPGHIYTPDVKVVWNPRAIGVVTLTLKSDIRKKKNRSFQTIISQLDEATGDFFSIIEVKPSFDQNNMTRLAKINIKWVWEKHGDFVNIIIPEKHFDKTFTPKRFLLTNKSMKPRNIKYKNVITLQEFLEPKRNQSQLFS